jgi:hypothetical protein
MKRIQIARDLAPPAPPCFASRDSWLEFVMSAAEAQRSRGGVVDPLLFHPGGRVEFNRRMDFCADCMPSFALRMQCQGRCQPDHLLQFEPTTAETTTA